MRHDRSAKILFPLCGLELDEHQLRQCESRLYLDCLIRERGKPEVISVRVPDFLAAFFQEATPGESYDMPVTLYPRENKVYVSLASDDDPAA